MTYQSRKYSPIKFSDDYIHEVFLIWYRAQKCNVAKLYQLIPFNLDSRKPEESTLRGWVNDKFIPEADRLDRLVQEQIDNQVVMEKVEMVNRHSVTAKEMQDMALKYLRANESMMTTANAVRMYVEGVRIERESRGLPGLITEISKDTNEQLLDRVKNIFANAPMLEEAND